MSAIVEAVSSSQDALSVCLGSKNSNRLESLWWAMHHSDDPEFQALVVECYLDESATDGGSPTAVVGGLVIHKSHFVALDKKWNAMLDEFNLRPALHMKDFGSHGRFADMITGNRSAIFTRAVEIIKEHNICTIAVTLQHDEYRAIVPETWKGSMSAYGLCFIGCVAANHLIAKEHKHEKRIAFVVDSGNPYAKQVFLAHQALIERQTDTDDSLNLNLGSLTFDKDDNVTALQAADVICWAVRRRATGYPFSDGFGPIEGLLDSRGHNQSPISEVAMRQHLNKLEAMKPEILEEP